MPRIIRVDAEHPAPEALAEAAKVIVAGGLVAFPTETVYGLGADALDPAAVARIFAAKGRPDFNPLIVHVGDAAAARRVVRSWPEAAERLAAAFWPGPLTLVLPKTAAIPDGVTASLSAVAVRVPAHPVALGLLAAAGRPIAAPSANRYTELSPTTAEHVAKSLGDRVDLILDGGPTAVGIESTVVDLTGSQPRVLRPGVLSAERLAEVVGPLAPPVPEPAEGPRLSPGLVGRHYAPRARLLLVDPDPEALTAGLAAVLARRPGTVTGALLLGSTDPGVDHPMRMPDDPFGYARRLYAALHVLDDLGCDAVLVERPPATGAWVAVRDRLDRAAG